MFQNRNITISVVTVNFNNVDGLSRTIRSVLGQTFRRSIEFIIIDGGSDDGSVELVNEVSHQIDFSLVEKDSGIFDAMNKGINAASGDYIYFLNSGDIFYDKFVIEKVIDSIPQGLRGYLILEGRTNAFYNKEFKFEINNSPWVCHQSVFVCSELLKMLLFDPTFKVYGDLDLWIRISAISEFNPIQIEVNVCNFELGGVGNNPKVWLRRLADKQLLVKKHNLKSNVLQEYVKSVIGYVIYRCFGLNFYYEKYTPFLQYLRAKFN